MIFQLKEEHPEIPLERLCDLMSVSRSWYYERPSAGERVRKDVALRDAIERILQGTSGRTSVLSYALLRSPKALAQSYARYGYGEL